MGAKAPDFKPGEMLPGSKYRIVNRIGAGGMGVVYQVVKPPEIQGVLKLMSSDLTAHQEFRTRFLDEVRVLAQLDHPNIVKVFDYDCLTDGTPFYVMELLHGRTVRDVLSTMGAIPPRVAFEIARQLCEALHCAHTHDIPVIHRDIKPENIFLHAPRHGEPVVKLIDFGVIAVADRKHDGAFVGTWNYAAPEQIRGERATPATDLYAVGLVLYEMLCGSGPFAHLESGPFVAEAHLREVPAPVSKFAPWVPQSIVQLIDVALAKDPKRRPRDAHGFAERLFELEWANDGKDPNDRTVEGPLSRVLSHVGPPKSESKMPVIGVPPASRHEGPTIKGVGQTNEMTSPGEDALLAGLLDRADLNPLTKKAREPLGATPRMPAAVNRPANAVKIANVEVPTVDAPPSDPKVIVAATTDASYAAASTLKLAAKAAQSDTDTFSSQESDARRAPRGRHGKWIVALVGAVFLLAGVATFAAYRVRGAAATVLPTTTAATGEARTAIGITAAEVTPAATATATPSVSAVASAMASATATTTTTAPRGRGRGAAPVTPPPATPPPPTVITPAAPPTTAPAPVKPAPAAPPPSAKGDDSFMHTF